MPEPIGVARAVREIVGTTRRRTKKDPTAYPFFFIVGAGISAPMIPVASRIEAICREAAERDGLALPELSDDPMERYERMLTLINPNAADRQEFLHELIHAAPISPANLRLAHVLESRLLTNLVVTPNFDEMLTRALRLFGVDCVVCDHPKTVQRINPNRADLLQIVHVHGTHWFYDCCNLKGEIAARAGGTDNASMGGLLDRILFDRSPIVVGYSGWTTDVIMTALRRWADQQPAHNLYWFCHRASEAANLPAWLRNHDSVRIVVEQDPIDASAVFQAINTETGAKAPAITSDPLAFFASHLEKSLGSNQDEKDVYLIAQVINRVKRGSQLEEDERQRLSEEERRSADAVGRLTDAVRRSADDEVLQALTQIDVSLLSLDQCLAIDGALHTFYGDPRHDTPESIRPIFPVWKAAVEKVLSARPADEQARAMVAWTLLAETRSIGRTMSKAELDLLDQLLTRFGDLHNESIAYAMHNRVRGLTTLGRTEDAAAARQQFRRRFGSDPRLSDAVDLLRLNDLVEGDTADEEVAAFANALAEKYRGSARRQERVLRMSALRVQAGVLLRMRQFDHALAVADTFLNDHGHEAVADEIVPVLRAKATALAALDRREEALATLDEFERRFGNRRDFSWYLAEAAALRARLTPTP